MLCPLCEADNPEDLPECAECGKPLAAALEMLDLPEPPPDGLELNRLAGAAALPDAPVLAELEATQLASPDLWVPVQAFEVERSQVESPDQPSLWGGPVAGLESGRSEDDGLRTLPPEASDGTCPWCGTQSPDLVCDGCGRRKSRYTSAAPMAAEGAVADKEDTVLCPACFSRVIRGARCIDCNVPFPPALQVGG